MNHTAPRGISFNMWKLAIFTCLSQTSYVSFHILTYSKPSDCQLDPLGSLVLMVPEASARECACVMRWRLCSEKCAVGLVHAGCVTQAQVAAAPFPRDCVPCITSCSEGHANLIHSLCFSTFEKGGRAGGHHYSL